MLILFKCNRRTETPEGMGKLPNIRQQPRADAITNGQLLNLNLTSGMQAYSTVGISFDGRNKIQPTFPVQTASFKKVRLFQAVALPWHLIKTVC
jgi:hypothetical protein